MIRHSSLPKLAQCAKYESNPVAGPHAERGLRLDAAFRAFLMGKPVPVALSSEEQEAVMWAVDTARDLADGGDIEADEVNLKENTPGLDHIGTEDGRCEDENMSFDLKSGQSFRSYYEQMAAYALGNLERQFNEHFDRQRLEESTWTCVLLFCDQREFTRIEFNRATAKAVVDGVLEAVNDPNAQATPCQYCSWCVKADTCVARTAPIVETLAAVESQPTGVSLEALKAGLLADPERLGAFLTANDVFEEFVKDLKTKAKVLMKKVAVPGWKLQEEDGREHFDRIAIVRAAVAGKSGLDDLVANCGGKMTGTNFRAWCAKMGVAVQESQAIVGKDIVKLVADKKKKARAAK
jgi:hypothetical protein